MHVPLNYTNLTPFITTQKNSFKGLSVVNDYPVSLKNLKVVSMALFFTTTLKGSYPTSYYSDYTISRCLARQI